MTFETIEAQGTEALLEQLRDELTGRTYQPLPAPRHEIPKDGAKSASFRYRRSGIGWCKAAQAHPRTCPEADFQPGSFGYRPKRTAHDAIKRVADAIANGRRASSTLTCEPTLTMSGTTDCGKKMAQRVDDADIMHLLKVTLKASGKKGVPQDGVISPLLSNLYLNEVDRML